MQYLEHTSVETKYLLFIWNSILTGILYFISNLIRHTTEKFQNTKNKEKTLKSSRKKYVIGYRNSIWLSKSNHMR